MIQRRDIAVLDVFRAVRFIDTVTLSTILTPEPFPNCQRLRLRLPRLERVGLISRPARQLRAAVEFQIADEERRRGRPQDIWALADKGAQILELPGDWTRNNRRLTAGAFAHPLVISRIFALLRSAVNRGLIDIEAWQGENVFRERVAVRGRELPIVPDATFEISADGEMPFRAFLEVDNSTEPLVRSDLEQSSFFKKCIAYQAFLKRLLIPRGEPYVILTVAKTRDQAERLRRAAARLEDDEASPFFWFASQDDIAMAAERFLFEEVWKTASGMKAAIFLRPSAVHSRGHSGHDTLIGEERLGPHPVGAERRELSVGGCRVTSERDPIG